MFRIAYKIPVLLLVISCFIFSCSVPYSPQPPAYNIPKYTVIPHEEVMRNDFPTKKAVFLKFGTPTSKETFENIENWYFKLSEITSSNSIGISSGTGVIHQNPYNTVLNPINQSLIVNQTQVNTQKTNSTTVETYVKFWFINDSVSKWESVGVDYSKKIPNKFYDEEEAIKSEKLRKEWEENNNIEKAQTSRIIVFTISGLLFYFLLFY